MIAAKRTLIAVLTIAPAVLLTGCVSLPESGPIVQTNTSGSLSQAQPININPPGPAPGAPPDEIVRGFLEAMQASPISPSPVVAREFLAKGQRDTWQPTQTITYDAASVPPSGNHVSVTLTGAAKLDSRGAWDGTLGDPRLPFDLGQENGQWRILNPPDALIVPETWFEQRFRQESLYFFDPTGRVLVPDPVFVPLGHQLASSLIDGLLAGPPPDLSEYTLDLLPARLEAPSRVPISADGVADIRLSGEDATSSVSSGPQVQQMVAQLVWTLKQDPSIDALRVTIGDKPVRLPGFGDEIPLEVADKYAPYVEGSSTMLYGLRDGKMVSGAIPKALQPVPGPFGNEDFGLRNLVPDLSGKRAAGVTEDGTALLVGPVEGSAGGVSTLLSGSADLLRPAWDFSGRLWTVDRGPSGAVVRYTQGGTIQTLQVNGISGRDVKDFLVSRDGSRLVAVVHTPGRDDTLEVARILYSKQGLVLRAIQARQLGDPDAAPGQLIRDIAWRSPTSILLLYPVGRSIYQVRSATVDGAPGGSDTFSLTIDGHVVALTGTPAPDQTIYAFARGHLVDLTSARAGDLDIDPAVTDLTYAAG